MLKLKPTLFFMLNLLLFQSAAQAADMTTVEKSSRIPAVANASAPQAVSKLDVLSQRADSYVSAQEKHPGNRLSRIPAIMVRGAFDILSSPAEFIYTPKHESERYPRLWPVTSLTKTATNIFYRIGSGVYDIAFYPFAAPFVEETPPLTEKMGLAQDVWQNEDEY